MPGWRGCSSRGREGQRSGAHFGDSIGTFAHTQFFQEPSAPTQAADYAGAISAYRRAHRLPAVKPDTRLDAEPVIGRAFARPVGIAPE